MEDRVGWDPIAFEHSGVRHMCIFAHLWKGVTENAEATFLLHPSWSNLLPTWNKMMGRGGTPQRRDL